MGAIDHGRGVGAKGLMAAAALAAIPAAAQGQVRTPVGLLLPSVSVMSDYRFAGVSNSDREPTAQAAVYLWRPDGIYAGGELTRVRFNDGRGTDLEVSAYGGRNVDLGKTRVTLEAMAVLFPGQGCCGPTYDFWQATGKVRRRFGPLALTADATWTPNASYDGGPAWRFTGDALWQVRPGLTLNGKAGVFESERRQDRIYWEAGATLTRRRVALDVRYVATDLAPAQCFGTDWCADAVVTRLTYSFLP